MKRTLKKLAIIMALVIGIVTGCGLKDDIIVSRAYEEGLSVPMFISFPDEQDEATEEIDPTEEISQYKIIGKANKDTDTMAVIKSCQKQIINYFSKRDIDVSEQLAALENVYIYRDNGSDLYVAGYYNPDSMDVYLNEFILSDEDNLKFTYIHEIMHYLGFADSETTMMQEGMADAITEDILGYAYTESYDVPRELSHQLLVADPDLLSYILKGGDLDDRIDTRLENVPREWYVEEHNMNLLEILDVLLYQIEYAELGIDTDYESFVNQCQSIVLAYCGTFDLTKKQMDEINKHLIYFDKSSEPITKKQAA